MRRIFFVTSITIILVTGLMTAGCAKKAEVKSSTSKRQKKVANKQATNADNKSKPKSQYDNSVAVIETNKGKIVFKFYPDVAPNTVANFVKLANNGFYNGIKFHRVEPGFVIQGGDPLSKDNDPSNDGLGGPGYTIKAEFNNKPHLTGTVAMARRAGDPDSAGSQFYICLAPQPSLDGKYTVFGQVIEGMDVVRKIQKGDVMNKVYIEKR
jgi:peptidyl-prolyl cis-trans isomerase B (cyclophilin B)